MYLIADDDKMLAQMKQDYANWKPKRRSRQTRGVFYSQYKSVLPTERLPNREALQAAEKLQRMVPGRRLSSIQLRNHSVGDGSFAVVRFTSLIIVLFSDSVSEFLFVCLFVCLHTSRKDTLLIGPGTDSRVTTIWPFMPLDALSCQMWLITSCVRYVTPSHLPDLLYTGSESNLSLALGLSYSLLLRRQSFFTSMTSNLCEALVCGQEDQGIFLIDIPRTFIYRYFGDIFRACLARSVSPVALQSTFIFFTCFVQVLPLGLYRGASKTENSYMPFVYTCPPPRTVLNMSDRVYVFGAPKDIKAIQKVLALPFQKKGNLLQLGACQAVFFVLMLRLCLMSFSGVDEETVGVRRRSMAPSTYGHGPAGSRSSIAGNSVLNAALAAKKAVEEAGG